LEAADVLVGDPRLRSFEARNRLLAEFDVGVFGDKDHALRFGLDGYEWDRLARRPHEWMIRRAHHGDDIAADDRTLEDLPFHHAGGVGAELDRRLLRRREGELVSFRRFGLSDRHPFADAHVGVLTGEAVDADGVRVPVLPVCTPDLRGSRVCTLDFDDVARTQLQMQQRVRVESGDTTTRVVRVRFRDLQLDFVHGLGMDGDVFHSGS